MSDATGHRSLLQLVSGPVLARFVDAETIRYVTGQGGTLASQILGLLSTWALFYVALIAFYFTFCRAAMAYCAWKYPKAPTNAVPERLVANMIAVSHRAFPLYVTVPMVGDFFRVKGWSQVCDTVGECGGWVPALIGCVVYFLAVELLIFVDHYYFLHKLDSGKRLMKHEYHHVYKYADQLNAFSGFSFAPQDGWSQGLPLALCTLFIPVPTLFVMFMEVVTGVWTLYIHTDVAPLPWPFMGCDYHYIHHKYNWYNFGFMTQLFDTLFGTIKHPKADALQLSHGLLPMPVAEQEKSAVLTERLLQARGLADCADALKSDVARGGESGESQGTPMTRQADLRQRGKNGNGGG